MTRVMIAIGILITLFLVCSAGYSEDEPITYRRWVLCQPGSEVMLRERPKKTAAVTGALICGDRVETDDVERNGYLHILGVGEAGEAWISTRYIVYDQPREVNERMRVWDKGRVAGRKWVNGKRKCWLKAGSGITVYWISKEWAVTDRGYVNTDYIVREDKEEQP